jgi:biotin synthase
MTAQAVDQTILDIAREQVLERGEALRYDQLVQVLQTDDEQLADLLVLAHDVRLK